MSTATYTLHAQDLIFGQDLQFDLWLHDIADDPKELEIEAFAASGDALEMLANELDQLMPLLEPDSAERYRLARTIEILLYLQEHHSLTRKTQPRW